MVPAPPIGTSLLEIQRARIDAAQEIDRGHSDFDIGHDTVYLNVTPMSAGGLPSAQLVIDPAATPMIVANLLASFMLLLKRATAAIAASLNLPNTEAFWRAVFPLGVANSFGVSRYDRNNRQLVGCYWIRVKEDCVDMLAGFFMSRMHDPDYGGMHVATEAGAAMTWDVSVPREINGTALQPARVLEVIHAQLNTPCSYDFSTRDVITIAFSLTDDVIERIMAHGGVPVGESLYMPMPHTARGDTNTVYIHGASGKGPFTRDVFPALCRRLNVQRFLLTVTGKMSGSAFIAKVEYPDTIATYDAVYLMCSIGHFKCYNERVGRDAGAIPITCALTMEELQGRLLTPILPPVGQGAIEDSATAKQLTLTPSRPLQLACGSMASSGPCNCA